jgi:hypothetical protein
MEDYTEGRFEVFLKGYKLINRKTIWSSSDSKNVLIVQMNYYMYITV